VIERALRQFSRPTGLPGRVAGRLMARMNGPLHDWVIGLLDVRPTDRVLEVGYGPGLGVERSSALAREGHVAGIDVSRVMWRQARRRNRRAIREGRVDLRVGDASALPFPDRSFHRALSVNSLRFWPSAEKGLSEILRTLRPGGRLALALRMRRDDVGRFDRSRFGLTDSDLEELLALLATVGFRDVHVERRAIHDEHMAAMLTRGT
jgi:ubiquinone/menaquinone biosynthesis C-methylase UbiE